MKATALDESLLVYCPQIDRDHAVLFDLMAKLGRLLSLPESDSGSDVDADSQILFQVCGLGAYLESHFENEEDWMQQASYPDYAAHAAEHAALLARFKELTPRVKAQPAKEASTLFSLLDGWQQRHVRGTDRQLAEFLNRCNLHLEPRTVLDGSGDLLKR